MESINKFKALTIIIVCMFVFIVAAIYSNTKDAAVDKTQQNREELNSQSKSEQVNGNSQSKSSSSVEYLETQYEILNKRVDELNEKVSSNDSGARCKIIGISNSDGIEKMSQDAAIEAANENGSELVVTCSF